MASFPVFFAHLSPVAGHWSVALTWATIWALLTQLSLTVARVPWLAWGIELSHEYHEKTRLVPSTSERVFGWMGVRYSDVRLSWLVEVSKWFQVGSRDQGGGWRMDRDHEWRGYRDEMSWIFIYSILRQIITWLTVHFVDLHTTLTLSWSHAIIGC